MAVAGMPHRLRSFHWTPSGAFSSSVYWRVRSGLVDSHISAAGAHWTPCADPLLSDEASPLPVDDGPSTTSDGLGDEQDYWLDTPLYDPFDRPDGEVIVQALSPSRSRSPRRA